MTETGVIGRVVEVRSMTVRVLLEVGSTGFTKVGPDGLHTVGVVNSYITIPAGPHRVVAIVSGVYIRRQAERKATSELLSADDGSTYELEATVVGRFENDTFRSGLTGYPPLHSPARVATPAEVKSIFISTRGPALRIGTSAVATEQQVFLDANLLLGHHCAIVGSTGSGKSCTVTAVIDGLLDHDIPGGHIIIFDVNGEYAQSFGPNSRRGAKTRSLVLGPKTGSKEGLFLPHWFMNNEEHLGLLRASEGVQAPVLQRSVADARIAGAVANVEVMRLQNLITSIAVVEAAAGNARSGSDTAVDQIAGMIALATTQVGAATTTESEWQKIKECLEYGQREANLLNTAWTPLTAPQRDILSRMLAMIRTQITAAFGKLGMGSAQAANNFDAPVFYSLQALCDFFLPNRVQLEQGGDNRIASYVSTLQMRLSRLLADGRYDFITRVERHADPLGSYLKALMGADPTLAVSPADWPATETYRAQATQHNSGPSVTVLDLSLVATDVLENVAALLGRLLFDFSVRSERRAEHPVLLVLEEAHRFIPSRKGGDDAGARSAGVFERIAKEGRKFGLSLLVASQRPSELSETVVAQCGTVIAHRLTHEADQNLLRHATSLSSRDLLDQLPSLAQQHALVTGVSTGVPVAVRIRDVFDPPRSDDPDFIGSWTDSARLDALPAHIDQIATEWQGVPSS